MEIVARRDNAAGPVVGVLETDHRGLDAITGRRPHSCDKVGGAEDQRRAAELTQLHAAQCGGCRDLRVDNVRLRVEENFGARPALHPDGGLVGHGPAGKEQRPLFAEPFGHDGFEPARGGIPVEDIIPDFRVGHRATHRGGRSGDGVTAHIEQRSGEFSHGRWVVGRLGGLARIGVAAATARIVSSANCRAVNSFRRRSNACATSPPMRNSSAP